MTVVLPYPEEHIKALTAALVTEHSEEWADMDLYDLLALPLHRWLSRSWYPDPRLMLYSNGSEHEVAVDIAGDVLEMSPVLRAVLLAGIAALRPAVEAWALLQLAGEREDVRALEERLRLIVADLAGDPVTT